MDTAIAPEFIDGRQNGLGNGKGANISNQNGFSVSETRQAGIAILDEHLRYVEVNETLANINGLPAEKHIGKTVAEVIPSIAPIVEQIANRVLRSGEPELNVEIEGEVGTSGGVHRHWTVSMVPLTGEDGKPHGVGALVLDFTEKRDRHANGVTHLHDDSVDRSDDAVNTQAARLNSRIKILKEVSVALSAAADVLENTRSAELYHTLDVENGIDFNDEVRRFEINLIERALKESDGNQKKAAGLLNLKHTTLHTKIKRYDIPVSH